MAYIGKSPAVGNFQVCDAISTVNGQASYTMQVDSVNVVPESANHMLVSLNGILQKAGSSFTVSSSTITFASNLVTGDVIDFIQILGNVLDLGVPSDATVTNAKTNFVSTSSSAGLQIKGDNTTAGTLQLNCEQNSHGIKLRSPPHSASASYTLTFPNNDGSSGEALTTNGSGVLTWASAGGTNTPSFFAYKTSSTQSINSGTITKVTFNTELYDSDNNYASDRFTPQTAGKYFFSAGVYINGNQFRYTNVFLRKNGSTNFGSYSSEANGDTFNSSGNTSFVVYDMNGSSDYVEVYAQSQVNSGNIQYDNNGFTTYFQGFKLIT